MFVPSFAVDDDTRFFQLRLAPTTTTTTRKMHLFHLFHFISTTSSAVNDDNETNVGSRRQDDDTRHEYVTYQDLKAQRAERPSVVKIRLSCCEISSVSRRPRAFSDNNYLFQLRLTTSSTTSSWR